MITYNKAISAVITVTLINGFFSTNMFKKYDRMYSNQITELRLVNHKLKERLSEYEDTEFANEDNDEIIPF